MTDRRDLPLYVHELVLGADIGVRQRDNGPTDVSAFGERGYLRRDERRYVAAWARRTIERPTVEGSA